MKKSAGLLLLLAALAACRSSRPEDRVRAAFEACRTAVEAGDAAKAAEPLARDFRGPDGMDRATARLFLAGILQRQRVGITVIRNDLRWDGRDLLEEVDLVLTGRSGGILPEDTSRKTFLLRWREEGGAWKLAEVQSPEGS